MNMVGVAVIGTGYWGTNHLRVFKQMLDSGDIDSLKVCDSREQVA